MAKNLDEIKEMIISLVGSCFKLGAEAADIQIISTLDSLAELYSAIIDMANENTVLRLTLHQFNIDSTTIEKILDAAKEVKKNG